jgi:DNA modification methylase
MIHHGDCLEVLKGMEKGSAQTCVTSPPYWGLRDYGVSGQLGLEKTPEEYVSKMVEVFREVKRVLRDDGTLWLNLGDSYCAPKTGSLKCQTTQMANRSHQANALNRMDKRVMGLKPKDLVGIPWRVAFALQQDGWYLRQDIIWHKPNPMPESVKDRCTKAHEYIFLLSKSPKYFFDHHALKEPCVSTKPAGNKQGGVKGRLTPSWTRPIAEKSIPSDGLRHKRSVWSVTTKSFKGSHFATFPQDLIEPCILAGSPKGGIVLDPFFGAGTVGLVARKHERKFIGIELNQEYIRIAKERLSV